MSEHFRLDVDPEQLRAAARELSRVSGHLEDGGRAARDTPGQVGDQWTGEAATSIKAEMAALGGAMLGFRRDFETSADALRSLAQDYEDALKQVADLNRKWEDAEEAYRVATVQADAAFKEASSQRTPDGKPLNRAAQEEFRSTRRYAYDQASDARRTEQHNLEYAFGMMKQWLAQQTRVTGAKLVEAAPFEVTSEQVSAWSGCGAYPVKFDRSSMWNTLKVAGEVEELALTEAGEERAAEDVARLNELLEHQPIEDPGALTSLLRGIGANADDPYYAEALTRALGPDGLDAVYDSIDGYLTMNLGEGHDPDDFWPAIEALNNVVAHGLTRYNDADLANYVGDFAGPMGGPPRLALILGSEYADGRLNGLGLAYVTRMREQKYQPGSMWIDVANRLQHEAFPDGFEDMVRQFADRTDTDALAQLMHNAGEDAQWIADGLLDTGELTADGIVYKDVWAAKQQVVLAVLAQGMDENYAGAVEALFTSLNQHNSFYTEDLLKEVAGVLDEPDRMMMLAANATIMDAEVVARLADRVMDKIDVEDLLAEITVTGVERDMGSVRLARDLGYVLGLSDAADISVDNAGVLEAVVGALAGATGRASVVAGPAVSILTAMVKAQEEADKKFEDYGKNWSLEHQHEMLAWALYVEDQGVPPGYDQWLQDNEDRIPTDSPDQAVALYLQDLSSAPDDSREYAAWVDIEGLLEQIGETRRIGGVD